MSSKLPSLSKLVGGQNVFNLPRLPIPSLEATAARYGRSCEGLAPLVASPAQRTSTSVGAATSEAPPSTSSAVGGTSSAAAATIPHPSFADELKAHLATLDNFVKTSGPKIQKELIERDEAAAKTGEYPFSYIEPIWDDGYLDFDDPLPMYVSPGYSSLPLDPSWSQATVAAKLARSCAKWFIAASEGELPKTTKDGNELCLSGLAYQMGFARKPGALRDGLHVADTLEDAIRYVTVVCKGHLYLVSLVNQQGKLRSEKSLSKAFETILAIAKDQPINDLPVCVLTTSNRRDWFKARSALKDKNAGGDVGNSSNLRYIEDSLTVVCLDDHLTTLTNSQRCKNQLTGLGEGGICNRWCDKHQLIVSAVPGDGFSATCEHAFSDAMVWSEWLNAVYKDMVNGGSYLPNPDRIIISEKEHQQSVVVTGAAAGGGETPTFGTTTITNTATVNSTSSADSATTTTTASVLDHQQTPTTTTTTTSHNEQPDAGGSNQQHHHPDHPTTATSNVHVHHHHIQHQLHHHQHHHHNTLEEIDEDDALLEKPVSAEEVKKSRNVKLRQTPVGKVEPNGVICLSFKLNDVSKQAIATARRTFKEESDNLKQVGISLPFGKNDCKSALKISPDALCQAAYHLGYARTHRTMAPTYESCSTGKFFHGRTETIRSASPEMNDFVRNALAASSSTSGSGSVSSETCQRIAKFLRLAAEAHRKLGIEAGNGEGVDRHLLALKVLVKEFADKPGLAFFSEPMYGRTGTWNMSTSNVSQPSLNWFSFGPVTPLGYGLGYCVKDDVVNVAISSTRNGYPERTTAGSDSVDTDADLLAKNIMEAAQDILIYLKKQ